MGSWVADNAHGYFSVAVEKKVPLQDSERQLIGSKTQDLMASSFYLKATTTILYICILF